MALIGDCCARLDTDKGHPVGLLLAIAKVDDNVGDLLNVLWELHFLIL